MDYFRINIKKTPAGKGGEEPAGEKEEMLQQNANVTQQIVLFCHPLVVAICFYYSQDHAICEIYFKKTYHTEKPPL